MKINQHGLTLVEVLAIIVLSSFLLMLIFGILTSGEKQIQQQKENNSQIVDTAFILKVITKDVRKNPELVSIKNDDEGRFEFLQIGTTKYYLDGSHRLLKDSEVLGSSVEKFEVIKVSNQLQITLKIYEEDEKTIGLVLR